MCTAMRINDTCVCVVIKNKTCKGVRSHVVNNYVIALLSYVKRT